MERMPRPWTKREREDAVIGAISRGFIEIRTIAYKPEIVGDPAAALKRIHMIANACHNLPGVTRRSRRGKGPDPFAWAWDTASSDEREWFTTVFRSLRLDTAWLDTIPVRKSSDGPRRTRGRIRIRSRKRTDWRQ
jgi:hypothetical protein